jgi:hypothetical protein
MSHFADVTPPLLEIGVRSQSAMLLLFFPMVDMVAGEEPCRLRL